MHAQANGGEIGGRLLDLGDERIVAMDETGMDVQVLSLTAPGVQSLEPADAVALQTASNDMLAEVVRNRPDRFQGFATLATPDPAAAARELERAVTKLRLNGAMLFGRTRDRNLDHRDNWPIFEAAAALRAPLYIHPQSPVPAVREAIYGGFDEAADAAFATFGLGWHYETGVQILRMVLAGVFDRFPDLQLITGHWGEVVLFYLDRIDNMGRAIKLARKPSEYFRYHVMVTPSGMWSQRYLRWSMEVLGPERILFSSDYPYRMTPDQGARRFLEEAELSKPDREAIATGTGSVWWPVSGAVDACFVRSRQTATLRRTDAHGEESRRSGGADLGPGPTTSAPHRRRSVRGRDSDRGGSPHRLGQRRRGGYAWLRDGGPARRHARRLPRPLPAHLSRRAHAGQGRLPDRPADHGRCVLGPGRQPDPPRPA